MSLKKCLSVLVVAGAVCDGASVEKQANHKNNMKGIHEEESFKLELQNMKHPFSSEHKKNMKDIKIPSKNERELGTWDDLAWYNIGVTGTTWYQAAYFHNNPDPKDGCATVTTDDQMFYARGITGVNRCFTRNSVHNSNDHTYDDYNLDDVDDGTNGDSAMSAQFGCLTNLDQMTNGYAQVYYGVFFYLDDACQDRMSSWDEWYSRTGGCSQSSNSYFDEWNECTNDDFTTYWDALGDGVLELYFWNDNEGSMEVIASSYCSASSGNLAAFFLHADGCIDRGGSWSQDRYCNAATSSVSVTSYSSDDCTGTADWSDEKYLATCFSNNDDFSNDRWDDRYGDDYENSQSGCCASNTAACFSSSGAAVASCFAADQQVSLADGSSKDMSEVQAGDSVLVMTKDGSLVFSEVVFVPHAANTEAAVFVELKTESNLSLKVTESHLVSSGACGQGSMSLTRAEDVAVGSCLQTTVGESKVVSTSTSVGNGIYSIVAKESSGLIVVNGIVASSFADNHVLTNMFYNVHRALYETASWVLQLESVKALNLFIGAKSVDGLSM